MTWGEIKRIVEGYGVTDDARILELHVKRRTWLSEVLKPAAGWSCVTTEKAGAVVLIFPPPASNQGLGER